MSYFTPPAVLSALGLTTYEPAAGSGAFLVNPPFAMTEPPPNTLCIRIDCHGGQIGRFWWENSYRGGFFQVSGESSTTFRPGRCGWDETWPDQHSWPVSPWGKGDAENAHWREFTAFEPWLDRWVEDLELGRLDLNIEEKIEFYEMLRFVFHCGIDAGRNPWSWAEQVEQQQTQSIEES